MLQWRALLNSMFGVIYVITEASHAKRINYLKTALLLMIDAAQVNAYVFERDRAVAHAGQREISEVRANALSVRGMFQIDMCRNETGVESGAAAGVWLEPGHVRCDKVHGHCLCFHGLIFTQIMNYNVAKKYDCNNDENDQCA